MLPGDMRAERFETGDVVIEDRYGSAIAKLTLEYRHMDEEEPRTKLEDSSVLTTPMVVSGGDFTVALMSDGTVWAWGDNTYGQVGSGVNGSAMPYANQPMQVRSHMGNGSEYGDYLKDIVKVAAGKTHALALDRSGNVYAWGDGRNFKVGGNTVNAHPSPVKIRTGDQEHLSGYLSNVVDIAAGEFFSVAVDEDGYVYTWGGNQSGVLGVNRTFSGDAASSGFADERLTSQGGDGAITPRRVLRGTATGETDYINHRKELIVDPTWGDFWITDDKGNATEQWIKDGLTWTEYLEANYTKGEIYLSNIVHVAAGSRHILALDQWGNVYAWGDNVYGQLGNARDMANQSYNPTYQSVAILNDTMKIVPMLSDMDDVVSIAAYGNTSAAIRRDGTLWVWGQNTDKKLIADSESEKNATAVQVKLVDAEGNALAAAKQVAVGADHMAVLLEDGSVYTWGGNDRGQLGSPEQGASTSDLTLAYVTDGAKTEDGLKTAYALDGKTHIAGANEADLNRVLSVAVGDKHTAVLLDDGHVYVFGDNQKGQTGNLQQATVDGRPTPDDRSWTNVGVKVGVDNRINTLYLNEITNYTDQGGLGPGDRWRRCARKDL